MTQTSADPPDIHDKDPVATSHAHGGSGRPGRPGSLSSPGPLNQSATLLSPSPSSSTANTTDSRTAALTTGGENDKSSRDPGSSVAFDEKSKLARSNVALSSSRPGHSLLPASSAQEETQGTVVEHKEGRIDADSTNTIINTNSNDDAHLTVHDYGRDDGLGTRKKRTFAEELRRSFWLVATHSWLNVLLVFVPVGIVVANIHGIHGGLVFAMNCIAVIPLAGLLSHATESVASKMGDSLGALLNVTFGNAVELIIFIIALVKNEIRIVQASLLGSILANLLLILGMGFFLGGLRFREQIYNSTVTQMSACLLSLSVISLVLPTAFHASFKDSVRADEQSLKISRGTSVVLLLVYLIYLLFQLKSHAYMYESTPQHIVDAESTPGPAAAWLDSSSSSDDASSSSDSDSSNRSRDTISRKVKKVLRGGRRRKSSVASMDTGDARAIRNASASGRAYLNATDEVVSETPSPHHYFPRLSSRDETDSSDDEQSRHRYRRHGKRRYARRKHRKTGRRHDDKGGKGGKGDCGRDAQRAANEPTADDAHPSGPSDTRRVDFAVPPARATTDASAAGAMAAAGEGSNENGGPRRPLSTLRSMSVKNFTPAVFAQKFNAADAAPATPMGPVPRVRYGIRRTNSLPDRLGRQQQTRPAGALFPAQIPLISLNTAANAVKNPQADDDEHLTRTAAVILLLATTALVAVCAEFLVDSIKEVTESSGLGEVFIGLIILPIVGNAAEHVTAVTVAMKNKMDLAIGVAVGSSIQIALFVTPLVVILGWIMNKEMTLYFTLFETVCLFVSAFIVNFLVLDGRSNYLEGALLCAVYIIIAVVAFFFPSNQDANHWGH